MRRRPLRPLPWWVALVVSVCAHTAALYGLVVFGGSPFSGGEAGLRGASGETLEIAVQSSVPSRPQEGEPDAVAQPESEAQPEPAEVVREQRPRSRRHVAPVERGLEVQGTAGEPAPASAPAEPSPPPETVASVARAGSDREQTGRAAGDPVAAVILGSVGLGGPSSGARPLLESALTCSDPVAGVWTAHRYSPARRDWGRMTLRIERQGDELRGTITSRVWSGTPSDRRPLPCAPGRFDVTVRMPAQGRVHGDRFSFGATSYDVARVDCPFPEFIYYPDRFTGEIDSMGDELAAVNNDGHVEFNAPYTFRRTSCGE